jgi:hypothetical protein
VGRPRKNLAADLMPPEVAASDSEITAEFEYQDYVSTLGDTNVTVTIHRFPKFGNVLEWCENASLDRAQLETIRENHGPGKYKLTFRGPTGFMGSKMICIAPEYDKNGTNGTKPAANAGAGSDFIREQLVMQQNLMMALMSSMKGPDIGAMMAGLAAMMTALKPAGDNGAKPVDPLAMFQAILGMYQNLKPKEEKSELDRLRDTAAVIKEFSGEGKAGGIESGWDALATVGKEAIDKLSPILTGVRPPAPVTITPVKPPVAVLPAPQMNAAPGVPGQQPAPNTGPNLQQWLIAQLAFFKTKAQAGKDPGFWIDYIFENAEEPGCQAVLYAIRQGATLENLLSFDPEIAQNPQLTLWFREVYLGIRSELPANVDSGREGGDAGDSQRDGAIGSPGLPATVSPPVSGNVS